MSTTEDSVEKVQAKFGGTWVKYAEDMTLVGASSSKEVNSTGGANSVTLKVENLPSHSHTLTPTGSVKSTFKGSSSTTSTVDINHTHYFSANTSTNGNHTHGVDGGKQTLGWHERNVTAGKVGLITNPTYYAHPGGLDYAGDHYHSVSGWTGTMSGNNTHNHTLTAAGSVSSTFTGTEGTTSKTGSGTSFSVQNPYIAVYMYKRTA